MQIFLRSVHCSCVLDTGHVCPVSSTHIENDTITKLIRHSTHFSPYGDGHFTTMYPSTKSIKIYMNAYNINVFIRHPLKSHYIGVLLKHFKKSHYIG